MAAYNEEKYIGEAIESILGQTYKNFEFIIVNDGSTDKTESIITSYTDERIKYIKNEENIKLIDSLNKGLLAAKGEYIARMDADDISLPNRLERQVSFMESNPDIGLSGSQLIVFGDFEGEMKYPLDHADILLHLFLTSSFGNNVVIFRKNILEQNKLYFPKGYFHAEDYKCWTNWVKHTKVVNLPDLLVKYRSHQESVSSKHRDIQRQTRNRIRLEYFIETFALENNRKIAEDLTGEISVARVKAIEYVLRLNQQLNKFPKNKFEKVLYDLWYLDCLDKVEKDFFVIFKFPFIFKLVFVKNLKRWSYLFKHWVKFKLVK
ncbi:MAG TPA: glycosyltransferase family 2 protein [Bacteroidia bacterium]|nr:glycosyltransferase family 2 protein [Bacteroidia bacterium]